MKMKLQIVIAAILILLICLICSYKYFSTNNIDGFYYRYDDGIDKLVNINGNIGKLYNIDQEGNRTELLMNIDITENNKIVLYTAYESYFFSLTGTELKCLDSDKSYKKISEDEFNKYLEEAKK